MLVEIICSNLLGLSVDLSQCSAAKLERLQTRSWELTSIDDRPVELRQLAKGKPNESRYREEADRERRRENRDNIRERGYERRIIIENSDRNYRYNRYYRDRIESVREEIEDIDDRIDDLEREKKRLEAIERRYRKGYDW